MIQWCIVLFLLCRHSFSFFCIRKSTESFTLSFFVNWVQNERKKKHLPFITSMWCLKQHCHWRFDRKSESIQEYTLKEKEIGGIRDYGTIFCSDEVTFPGNSLFQYELLLMLKINTFFRLFCSKTALIWRCSFHLISLFFIFHGNDQWKSSDKSSSSEIFLSVKSNENVLNIADHRNRRVIQINSFHLLISSLINKEIFMFFIQSMMEVKKRKQTFIIFWMHFTIIFISSVCYSRPIVVVHVRHRNQSRESEEKKHLVDAFIISINW